MLTDVRGTHVLEIDTMRYNFQEVGQLGLCLFRGTEAGLVF